MASAMLLDKLILFLEQELPRTEKAKAITDAIRAAGTYRWVGLYDVDDEKGFVSNIAWSGSGPPEYPVFPITKGLTARAIATKRTINVGDVASDAHDGASGRWKPILPEHFSPMIVVGHFTLQP